MTDQTDVTQDIRTGVYNLAIYFPDSRKLFIHFPKTGGTWIRKAAMETGIANVQLPRRTSAGSHKHLTRDFYRCPVEFVWTLVRRPDDWYVSWFRYAQQHSWPEYRNTAAHPQTCLSDCMADTFEGFIEHCLTKHPGYLSEMYALY
ncbi:MAG: hypothetical protein K8T91_18635, partial [Planctomycetes bacterium]|nr:hypothetical protein [Planctomycetota bacterium]